MDLSGRNVVITGGSTGIGAATALAFAEVGARVLVVARSRDALRLVADRTVGDHIVADLTVADDVDSLVDRCLDVLGHVDVWVPASAVDGHMTGVSVG